MSFTVDDLLDGVKRRSQKRKKTQEDEIKERRENAVDRIISAAKEHLDSSNKVHMKMLASRLSLVVGGEEEKPVRISLAEAYADLAELGDFSSGLYWWELRDRGAPVDWKGYTFHETRQRRSAGSLSMEIREVLAGGFVCEMTGATGRVCSYDWDVESGEGHSNPVDAIKSAYRKYCDMTSVPHDEVPFYLTDGIEEVFRSDNDDDDDYQGDDEYDNRFNC
jgi:hypothetical protein